MTLFHHKERELAVRLSVTVPWDLADYVRDTAQAAKVPMSAVVVDALRLHAAKATSDEMMAGLLEDAAEAAR